ncbi:MAG: ribosome silencing factor [Acidimicrobiales bacterium]
MTSTAAGYHPSAREQFTLSTHHRADHPGDEPNGHGPTPGPDDEIVGWVRTAVDAANDKLGRDTEAFFVGEVLSITDWFVITSGGSARQVRAIVDEIEEQLTRTGGPKPVRIEGRESLDWVLMDFGSFIVHVFSAETREYYSLERLWKDVPRLDDVA